MNQYETIFIVNANLAEEQYEETLKKFQDLITKLKGRVIKVDERGKQKLAYEVKKTDRGFYVIINYCSESGLIAEFERDLKLDDRIILFQTIKLSDKADPDELLRKQQELETKSEEKKTPQVKEEQVAQPEAEMNREVPNAVQ